MRFNIPLPAFVGRCFARNTGAVAVDPDTVNRFERKKLSAACALNMCMVSLSQIVDYQDLEILKMEYDTILNNLNLEKVVKDEALLKALQSIMDACHFYILHAKDKEMLKKKQQARLKDALPSALGRGNLVAIFNGNPWAMMAGAAVMIGVAAVNYKSQRDKAKLENEIEEWQLERSALEQLHNLRRTLFETAWRFAKKYNYPDSYRLTEKQISIYNEIIKNPDPQTRYESLWLIRENFKAYPIFWYYLGRAALETADAFRRETGTGSRKRIIAYGSGDQELYHEYRDKAKDAYQIFKRCHLGNELMREDLIAASAYLDHAELCDVNDDDDLPQILDDINHARQLAPMDEEVVQACAFRYLQLLEHTERLKACRKADGSRAVENSEIIALPKQAEFCLRFLLDRDCNPEINGRALSILYKRTKQSKEYMVVKALVSRRCPFVYARILPWDAESFIRDWKHYLNGSGIRKSAFNLYYACTWQIYRDFLLSMNEAQRLRSYEPLKAYREALKVKFGDTWKKNLHNPPFKPDGESKSVPEEIKDVAGTIIDVADAIQNPVWSAIKAVWRAKVEKDELEKDETLSGLMLNLLDDSFERVAWKLFLGTRASKYEPTKFELALKRINDALVQNAKVTAELFAVEFTQQHKDDREVISFADWHNETECDEPGAFAQLASMERETERLRKEIEELLGENTRFRFPDPQYPESALLSKSEETECEVSNLKRVGQETINKVREHTENSRYAAEVIDVTACEANGVKVPRKD